MAPRYAIYFAPERDTRLWHFGCRVLGRDPETGADVAQLVPPGFTREEWSDFTASPRRYGFHATLKAPFALAEGRTEDELVSEFRAFAAARDAITGLAAAPALENSHVVLLTPDRDARVHNLADECVAAFEPFRAPLSDVERQRRLASGLTPRQTEHLEGFGYPFVFEDFTFHLTLAGPLPKERAPDVLAALTTGYEQSVREERLPIRSLSLFVEPEPGAPFELKLRCMLRTAGENALFQPQ